MTRRLLTSLLAILAAMAALAESPAERTLFSGARFVPLATPWVYKACGGATRSGWGRMAASQALGAALTIGIVETAKHSVTATRPDGSGNRSFPSGHAAIAFMGATMMTREMAWRSPWYGLGAWSVASAVAAQRVIARRHFAGDVAAGAAIGVAAAEIGYLVCDLIAGSRWLDPRYRRPDPQISCSPYVAVSTGIEWTLSPTIHTPTVTISRRPAMLTAIEGGLAIGRGWTASLQARLATANVSLGDGAGEWCSASSLRFMLGAGRTFGLSRRFLLTASAAAGYSAPLGMTGAAGKISQRGGSTAGELAVDCAWAATDRLSLAARAGYVLSGSKYRVEVPISPTPLTVKTTDNSLNISLASRITF